MVFEDKPEADTRFLNCKWFHDNYEQGHLICDKNQYDEDKYPFCTVCATCDKFEQHPNIKPITSADVIPPIPSMNYDLMYPYCKPIPRRTARIDEILAKIRSEWLKRPDCRLGQLLIIQFGFPITDIYHVEDTIFGIKLREG